MDFNGDIDAISNIYIDAILFKRGNQINTKIFFLSFGFSIRTYTPRVSLFSIYRKYRCLLKWENGERKLQPEQKPTGNEFLKTFTRVRRTNKLDGKWK